MTEFGTMRMCEGCDSAAPKCRSGGRWLCEDCIDAAKSPHTSGIWTQELDGSVVIGGQVCITQADAGPDDASKEERQGNLKLISAAPNLLAACKARLECDEMWEQGTEEWQDAVMVADTAMNFAIDKATTESK